MAAFVDWYNNQQRLSGIKFVSPQQRHEGKAVETGRHRADVCERARQLDPGRGHDQPAAGVNRRWFGSISRQMSSMNQGSYR